MTSSTWGEGSQVKNGQISDRRGWLQGGGYPQGSRKYRETVPDRCLVLL